MTLRIMLVGLVASLGFELPSGSDVTSWAQAGSAWVQAQGFERSGTAGELRLDVAGPSDCQQVEEKCEIPVLACDSEKPADRDSDAAYKAILDRVVDDLTAELLADHREESPADEAGPKVAVERPAMVALPEGEEAGVLVVIVDEAKTPEIARTEDEKTAEPVVLAEPVVESLSRLDRVSTAVRLTREAVQAWAAVMQETVED